MKYNQAKNTWLTNGYLMTYETRRTMAKLVRRGDLPTNIPHRITKEKQIRIVY